MLAGREVEFESELMKGSVFVALKRDVNLDPKTHHSFFDGKGRTVQLQWSVTLKRKLQGPLFIGFESNQSRQTGSLPVSCLLISNCFDLLVIRQINSSNKSLVSVAPCSLA